MAAVKRAEPRRAMAGGGPADMARAARESARGVWGLGIVHSLPATPGAAAAGAAAGTRHGAGFIDAELGQRVCRVFGLAELPPIAVSDRVPTPLVLGCLRPVVVLPRELADKRLAEQLRDVLVHECRPHRTARSLDQRGTAPGGRGVLVSPGRALAQPADCPGAGRSVRQFRARRERRGRLCPDTAGPGRAVERRAVCTGAIGNVFAGLEPGRAHRGPAQSAADSRHTLQPRGGAAWPHCCWVP